MGEQLHERRALASGEVPKPGEEIPIGKAGSSGEYVVLHRHACMYHGLFRGFPDRRRHASAAKCQGGVSDQPPGTRSGACARLARQEGIRGTPPA
jgi:hypothetical protein